MTDDQVIAKVRAAAMDVVDIYVPTRGDNIEIVCARAALAMVEQWEWHNERDTRSRGMEHHDAADRIMDALRKAVGE